MCDAEDAYRATWATLVGEGRVLMCWFHVKQAVRAWIEAHAQFPTLVQRRLLWKKEVEPAVYVLHQATFANYFNDARCTTIEQHCFATGVVAATTWKVPKGTT